MGLLAAMNEEVERGHLANLSLIFFVIFVVHSLTYRSALSGGIVLLQIVTASMLSLAYMAVRGVGLASLQVGNPHREVRAPASSRAIPRRGRA